MNVPKETEGRKHGWIEDRREVKDRTKHIWEEANSDLATKATK